MVRTKHKVAIAALVASWLAFAGISYAQSDVGPGPAPSSSTGAVSLSGTPAIGDCAKFITTGGQIGDSGGPCTAGASLGANTFTAKQTLAASTTAAASLNMPQGAAPTSPANGDLWMTSSGLFAEVAGAAVGPFGVAGSGGVGYSATPTVGDCLQAQNSTQIADSGAPCFAELFQPAFISGHWYQSPFSEAGTGSAAVSGRFFFTPFIVLRTMVITDLGARITTAATGGNIALAIYASSNATGRATGNPLAYTASLSAAAVGLVDGPLSAGSGSNLTLTPGIYWRANASDNSTEVCQAPAPAEAIMASMFGSATQNTISSTTGNAEDAFYYAGNYGTWPNMTSATVTEASTPSGGCLFQLRSN